ncbi:MAG: cytochrome C oxidase subunit IV family protein [Gammaproteobacteria bacterium]|jgi:hypothetical protein
MSSPIAALLRNRVTPIWLLLVAATGLSWWIGSDGGGPETDFRLVSTGLIAVAFIKVRFVLRYFMEVRTAALPLKLIADAWVVIVCGAVLALYWLA